MKDILSGGEEAEQKKALFNTEVSEHINQGVTLLEKEMKDRLAAVLDMPLAVRASLEALDGGPAFLNTLDAAIATIKPPNAEQWIDAKIKALARKPPKPMRQTHSPGWTSNH